MLYRINEFHRTLWSPMVHAAEAGIRMFSATDSWTAHLPWAQQARANIELFYRIQKDFPKPAFGIDTVNVRGRAVAVREQTVASKPFCRLQHFQRLTDDESLLATMREDPVVLLVAPLSGHHATLLRDTVESLLADHSVYVTDWLDARMVPLEQGAFSMADYTAYVREFIQHLGASRLHVMAVCQPTVPVLGAIALMAGAGEPLPRSLTLMGGPIDPRRSPTAVNELATTKPLRWFQDYLLHEVPARYPGSGRIVYPGFLQLTSFIAMNPTRHMGSHLDFYRHVLEGNTEGAEAHRRFYDEYNAVLDMPAEYYIDCVRDVFQEFLLPRGLWRVDGELVRPEAIEGLALLTVEGELDDITGTGQTRAAHDLCTGVDAARKHHIEVEGAGHYGIFSGRRWRQHVYPRVRDFIAGSRA